MNLITLTFSRKGEGEKKGLLFSILLPDSLYIKNGLGTQGVER